MKTTSWCLIFGVAWLVYYIFDNNIAMLAMSQVLLIGGKALHEIEERNNRTND